MCRPPTTRGRVSKRVPSAALRIPPCILPVSRTVSLRRLTRVILLGLALPAAASAAVFHVRPEGNDAADGRSWATARRTVTAGLALAQPGDEVWVAAGLYPERIHLRNEVALYGGFAGSETARNLRDWNRHLTILDGGKAGIVVRCEVAGASPDTRLDGFVVRNGSGVLGGGIACTATSPTLANNTILGNVSLGPGGGICCYNGANPVIVGNLILDNLAAGDEADGGGIACMKGNTKSNVGSSPVILGNVIARNRAEENGGGIVAKGIFVSDDGQVVLPSAPIILNNLIAENLSTEPPLGDRSVGGGGIACIEDGMAPLIANNTIVGNAGLQAGGILLLGGARDNPRVINNTLAGNNGPAFRWGGLNSLQFANNLVAFNAVGLSRSTLLPSPTTAVLTHNLVFGNDVDLDAVPESLLLSSNLRLDPRLAAPAYGDHHLQPDSPCIDAGDPGVVSPDWLDADGLPRVRGPRVDIGADEADGQRRPGLPRVIHVRPDGSDQADGLSWTTAKRTLTAAVATLHETAIGPTHTLRGGEVWVARGTYSETLRLPPYIHLYGGFQGGETTRDARQPATRETRIDAASRDRVILAYNGHRLHTIDGFTLTGGRLTSTLTDQGGGIECYLSGPRIANNRIVGNVANAGGGIGAFGSSALITDCVISNNLAGADGKGWGGGLHLDRSFAVLRNCVIARNAGSDGGGLYASFSQPQIVGCSIFGNQGKGLSLHNSTGLPWTSGERLLVARNLIYENLTSHEGGGIYVLFCTGRIENNLIALNRSGTLEGGGTGGGLSLNCGQAEGGQLVVTHNTILGNTAEYFGLNFGGAINTFLLSRPNLVLANNIIAYNSSGLFNQRASPVSPTLVRNLVFSNQGADYQLSGAFGLPGGPLSHPTDLSLDPRLVSLNGDFHLRSDSPALGAADPAWTPADDLDGRPRPLAHATSGPALPDLGAYEWSHPQVPGSLELAAPAVHAFTADGVVTIPVRRRLGLAGAVSAAFATRDGTARAGTEYLPASGRIRFADGQAEGTLQVSLLSTATGTGPRTLFVTLSQPEGGASLGGVVETTVTLHLNGVADPTNPWGIPAAWIEQYQLQVTATSDADGDGFLDRQEYVAGTHPRDPASSLRIVSAQRLSPAGQTLVVRWNSVPGRRYSLRRAVGLAGTAPFATVVRSGIPATGSVTETTDTLPSAQTAFYRIEVEP